MGLLAASVLALSKGCTLPENLVPNGTGPQEAGDQQIKEDSSVLHTAFIPFTEIAAHSIFILGQSGANEGQTPLLVFFIPVVTIPMSSPLRCSIIFTQPSRR